MASSLPFFLIVSLTLILSRTSNGQQPNPAAGPAPGAKPDIKTKFAQFTQKITSGLNQFKAQIQATLAGLMAKKMGKASPMGPPAGAALPDGQSPYTVNTAPSPNSGPLLFGAPRPRPSLLDTRIQPPRRIGSSVARVNNPSRNRQGNGVQEERPEVVTSANLKAEVNQEAKVGSVDQQMKKMMDNIEKQIDEKV